MIRSTILALIVFMAYCCGCVADVAPYEPGQPQQRKPYVGGMVFTAGPGTEAALALAIMYLNEASGAGFASGPDGIQVSLVEQAYKDAVVDGLPVKEPVCAVTDVTHVGGAVLDVAIELSVPSASCGWSAAKTLEHEMIHAVRADINPSVYDDHAIDGVFKAYATGEHAMTAASLTRLCEAAECQWFKTSLQ